MQSGKRFLASLAIVAVLVGALSAQAPTDRRAATVNGEAIMQSEVEAVIRASQPPSPTPPSEAQKKEIQANVLNMLIEDVLMRQYLKKNAPPVAAAEVDKRVQEFAAQLVKEKQTLAEFLKQTGQTEAQMRADIAARLQWEQFINPRLTDALVKKYYDDNKAFFDKVMVRASHILLKIAPNATQNDKQLVYNRLQSIRQEVLTGKVQFADAAKRYSECPSKDNGGDIGLFPYKFYVADAFARAAFSMKVGEISDVVATEFGYHIIKVAERTPGEASDFEKIKTEVKAIYAQEIYQIIITEQKRVAKIEMQ